MPDIEAWNGPTLRQLAYLLTVIEENSFTKAADRLRLSQPALSRQIRELERQVGGTLVDRQRGQLVPTAAGRALLPEAQAALNATQRGLRSSRAALSLEGGTLEIATLPTLAAGRLLPAIKRWHELHPQVPIRLREIAFRHELEPAVRAGLGDLGIGTVPADWDGPVQSLGWEEFVVVLPPGDPLSGHKGAVRLKSLADRDWVLYDREQGLSRLVDAACHLAGFTPRAAVVTTQVGAAALFASSGLGPALVPATNVPADLAGLTRHLDPPVAWEVAAFTRDSWAPAAEEFVALAQSLVTGSLVKGTVPLRPW